jgi:hypothetical protein
MLADPVPAVVVLAVAALLAAACQGDGGPEPDVAEPKLAALDEELLSTMGLPGGRLVLNTRLEEGTALGKPVDAQILRVFAFQEPERADEGREVAIDAAVASGWTMSRKPEFPGTPIYGAKTLATGGATVAIGRYEDEGVHKVSIQLEHMPCPKERCGGV